MPNYGGVKFEASSTNWTARAASQVDYFVAVAGAASPVREGAGVGVGSVSRGGPSTSEGPSAGEQIMHSYVDATGHSPVLPDWGAGYWHSRCDAKRSAAKRALCPPRGFTLFALAWTERLSSHPTTDLMHKGRSASHHPVLCWTAGTVTARSSSSRTLPRASRPTARPYPLASLALQGQRQGRHAQRT